MWREAREGKRSRRGLRDASQGCDMVRAVFADENVGKICVCVQEGC